MNAVKEWALEAFQYAFAALPDMKTLAFVELGDPTYDPLCRLPDNTLNKLLVVGKYGDTTSGYKDQVLAYVYGDQLNQVGYVVEQSERTETWYRKLNAEYMCNVDTDEPFCKVTDGSEHGSTISSRMRAFICYSFLASGHIKEFGAFYTFVQEFPKACHWIANGGVRPTDLPDNLKRWFSNIPSRRSNHIAGRELAEKDAATVKLEEPQENQSNEDEVDDLPSKCSILTLSCLFSNNHLPGSSNVPAPEDRTNAQCQAANIEQETMNWKLIHHQLGVIFERTNEDNGRLVKEIKTYQANNAKLVAGLKKELDEAYGENTQLKARVEELLLDKDTMRDELRQKRSIEGKLMKENRRLEKRFIIAEKKARNTKMAAKMKYDRKKKKLAARALEAEIHGDVAEKKVAEMRATIFHEP